VADRTGQGARPAGGRHAAPTASAAARAAREEQRAARAAGIDRRLADRRVVERRAGDRRAPAPAIAAATASPPDVQPAPDPTETQGRAAKKQARAQRAAVKAAQRDAKLRRWPWLWHAVRAWGRFKANNGTQFSAAITYFSFLALFPLILLGAAVTGFVLHSDPHLRMELLDKVAQNIPGDFGTQISKSINSAIDARTGVGVIGLVGVLLTGLGWISNLRQAMDAVAGRPQVKRNFLMSRLANLVVLGVLGLGVVVSLGLTVAGTALTDQLLRWTHLTHVQGMTYVVAVAGILLAVLGDLLIFGWLLVWLPDLDGPGWLAFRGVVLASVGFEVLKLAGTFTIARSAHSPTLGPFAGLLAVLIWIELVSRFLLYCVAWIASGAPDRQPARSAAGDTDDLDDSSGPPRTPVTPLSAAAWLVGVGAAAGAAAVVSWRDRRKR
jgi:membrane protein